MSTICCIAYISADQLHFAQAHAPSEVRGLYERKVLEAAEGRPIVRVCETDGLRLLRCDLSDTYAILVECEADG